MKGLAQGEQSSITRPILQLFVRNGGYLVAIYSGSFIIEDITAASPVVKVAATPITSADIVGTGRYALTTGSTSSWTVGSHRAVVTYTLEAGGQEYIQVIPFEILTAIDWPTGMEYVGYLSTKLLYDDEILPATVSISKAHRLIARASRQVETWTHRFFEPRYLEYRRSGQDAAILLLNEAIIAIEDIWAVWESTSGETEYKFEQYLYKVFNRHLDGYFAEDDRENPRIDLVNVDGDIVAAGDYAWPFGTQNVLLKGIFGYTNPNFDPTAGRTGVGMTPEDIGVVVGALVYRYNEDATLSSPITHSPGAIKSMRTRDQSISFGSGGGSSGGGGVGTDLSGDPLIDNILLRYCAPMNLVGV